MGKQAGAAGPVRPVYAGQWLEKWVQNAGEETPGGVRSVTEEIAPGDWDTFLERFTTRHQTWPVMVEQGGPDMAYSVQAANRPLAGIVVLGNDSGRAILICLASGKTATPSSCVAVPVGRHVWVKRNENGEDEALEIEAEDGTMTLLHVGPPACQR
jgi:hypothetical protein